MKLTPKEIRQIINTFEPDFQVETEHRKGSSFYATGTYEFDSTDVADVADLLGKDCSSLLGTRMLVTGVWDDDNGCEWFHYYHEVKTVTIVPEKTIVVPAFEEVTWSEIKEPEGE